MNNFFRRLRLFAREIMDELKKASWPTRAELRDSTVVVVLAALMLGLFTSISDFALYRVVSLFTSFVN
jgi:preprotein translocase subunit SecE